MLRPPMPLAGMTQARAATPSTNTVQAPHSPKPQPYFGLFNCRSLRKNTIRLAEPALPSPCTMPLTVMLVGPLLV